MYAVALRPGSWPPSPGFDPWAILISSWSALARYVAVTPNRADATCLIRASWRRPSGPGRYQAGSSPPSPVLALPPARWMPIVNAWWASGLSAPTLIAETTKRRTMDAASSTFDEWHGHPGTANVELIPGNGPAARRAGEGGPIPLELDVDVVGRGAVRPPPASRVISAAMRGEKRWASPSARNRANPGSGRRGSRPGCGSGMASAAARRRSCRSARSAIVVRPGQAAAVGKQRATTAGIEVDDVDQRAADVRRDGADPHPGEGLAQPCLERVEQRADGLGRAAPRSRAIRPVPPPARSRVAAGRPLRPPPGASPWRGHRRRPRR